jgi:hypothetical protein
LATEAPKPTSTPKPTATPQPTAIPTSTPLVEEDSDPIEPEILPNLERCPTVPHPSSP